MFCKNTKVRILLHRERNIAPESLNPFFFFFTILSKKDFSQKIINLVEALELLREQGRKKGFVYEDENEKKTVKQGFHFQEKFVFGVDDNNVTSLKDLNALESSLWEIEALSQHYHPIVVQMAREFKEKIIKFDSTKTVWFNSLVFGHLLFALSTKDDQKSSFKRYKEAVEQISLEIADPNKKFKQ